MSLSSTTSRAQYTGAASTSYAYPFKVFAATDLLVTKRTAAGTELTLAYPTDYTVSGVGDAAGGTVTLAAATLTTDVLTIRRVLPLTQVTSFRNQGPFLPGTHEDAFDRGAMIDQQVGDVLGRAVTLAETVDPATFDPTLPATVAASANQALFVNAAATGLELRTIDTSGIAVPGGGRTVATATAYLANNARFNVKDFGALGNGVADDATAIQNAINAAEAAGGGIVEFPVGVYLVSTTIAVPVNSANGITLAGHSMRDSVIQGTTAGMTVVRVGAAAPDASGTTTNQNYYGGARDLWITAGVATAGMGLYLVEPQKHEYRNLLVTGFNAAGGRGLYLKGSTTSGGVASPAAPHAWRNYFANVLVADCQRPLVLDNADENDFYGCNFGVTPSLTASADTLIAVEIVQGHNDRFYGALLSGETSDLTKRNAYVGVKVATPTQGDCLGHQFYGLVAEGFDRVLWVQGTLNTGCVLVGLNASICNVSVFNDGFDITSASNPEAKNGLLVEAPLHNLSYMAGRSRATPPITPANADTTPSVLNADTLTFSNAGATSVTNFTNGLPGQVIRCRMDANTTLVQGATMKLAGAVNFVGTTLDVITLVNIGGAWTECARSIN